MAVLASNKVVTPLVIASFVEQGWSQEARVYVKRQAANYDIANELDALKEEYKRLHKVFPKLEIAPLFVSLHDGKLLLPG